MKGCTHSSFVSLPQVLAVPMKATVKESAGGEFVTRTLDRKTLWEIHTPQVIRPEVRAERSDAQIDTLQRGY